MFQELNCSPQFTHSTAIKKRVSFFPTSLQVRWDNPSVWSFRISSACIKTLSFMFGAQAVKCWRLFASWSAMFGKRKEWPSRQQFDWLWLKWRQLLIHPRTPFSSLTSQSFLTAVMVINFPGFLSKLVVFLNKFSVLCFSHPCGGKLSIH